MSSPSTDATHSTSESDRLSASDALGYAFDEHLRLFAVIAIGWVIWQGGTALVARGFAGPGRDYAPILYGLVMTLIGFVVVLAAIVAVGYKLLVDSRSAET